MEEEYHAYTTSVWQILLVSFMIQWTMMTVINDLHVLFPSS